MGGTTPVTAGDNIGWGALGADPRVVYQDDAVILLCARWQDVDLPTVDSVITDPPYSERTHKGQRSNDGKNISAIEYATMDGELPDVTAEWFVVFSDHTGARYNETTLEARGLYVFAPVVWAKSNPTPRLAGDGPASGAEYITVARPRKRVRVSGSRPGSYYGPTEQQTGMSFMGRKPLWLMRALIQDYSTPGDIILDTFAGSGTTGRAARAEGRRCILIEVDPETAAKAAELLRKDAAQPSLFSVEALTGEQSEMFK